MKLIVQIPAYNEVQTIARTLRDIPKKIEGLTSVETLVIDDGSIDNTADAARKAGANHVIQLKTHRGLSAAFVAGVDAALRNGSEIDAKYTDFKDPGTPAKTFSSTGGWVGITDKYWMAAAIPSQGEAFNGSYLGAKTPAGVDLSAFALIRSLYSHETGQDGRVLYLNVDGLTNLAIAEGPVCRFTRVVAGGIESMAAELAAKREISTPEARALLFAANLADAPNGDEWGPALAEQPLVDIDTFHRDVSSLLDAMR